MFCFRFVDGVKFSFVLLGRFFIRFCSGMDLRDWSKLLRKVRFIDFMLRLWIKVEIGSELDYRVLRMVLVR